MERSYRLEAGEGELNLRNVRFTGDRELVRTRATVGAGYLKVVVPRDARVELDADLGAGEIRMPSRDSRPRADSWCGASRASTGTRS